MSASTRTPGVLSTAVVPSTAHFSWQNRRLAYPTFGGWPSARGSQYWSHWADPPIQTYGHALSGGVGCDDAGQAPRDFRDTALRGLEP
jgi:hypothetical protein